MSGLQSWQAERVQRVNARLDSLLGETVAWPATLHKAMRYCLFPGGKRLRPLLTLGTYELIAPPGTSSDVALPAACALELTHVYTLIHDDLPAMDDDDYRWSRPTCHRVFGEGLAILTGNSLLTLAFRILSDKKHFPGVPADLLLCLIQDLSEAAGYEGVLGGQSMDLGYEGPVRELEHLSFLHSRKTGQLFRAAARMGARLAGASAADLTALDTFADKLGLAFQITDDLLDEREPPPEQDEVWVPSYPALLGVHGARERAQKAAREAADALLRFDGRADPLRALALSIPERMV